MDYTYFNENYKLIDADLSKQQALDVHPKVIQQINFTGNLERVIKEIQDVFIAEINNRKDKQKTQ